MATAGAVSVSVSLAEVARIAGVGRAAVSNWRRRHDDFPEPVGGSDASPLFSLAEVESWLERNGKFKSRTPDLDRLWPRFEALRDRDAMGRLVAAVGHRLAAQPGSADELQADEASGDKRGLVAAAIAASERHGSVETFGFLLQRWLGTHVRQIVTTPEPLAALMAEMADRAHQAGRPVRTVLDPACGVGSLLLAAVQRWGKSDGLRLLGEDIDPVLAAVSDARLRMAGVPRDDQGRVELVATDSLRTDAFSGIAADAVLCNPPTNERDWGHAELATDPRWVFGQPPRTEPELAWVQHCVSALDSDGVAVVLLPPAVAARRAGRRVRAALLRTGCLRAVVALPPGAAFPYGVGLHLWLLGRPDGQHAGAELTFVDTAEYRRQEGAGRADVEWGPLRERVLAALNDQADAAVPGVARVPVVDLLDESVDLTPARYVPSSAAMTGLRLGHMWSDFDDRLDELARTARQLGQMRPVEALEDASVISVGDLERSGAVSLHAGQAVPDEHLRAGDRPPGAVAVLTIADLLVGEGPRNWVAADEVAAASVEASPTRDGDVVVAAATRAFDAWVEGDEPRLLGPQLVAVRADRRVLDPWFLAACLRAPANARQAGTHASTASRIDVRRLQVPRLPIEAQQRYGEIHRDVLRFESAVRSLGDIGSGLGRTLGELLATGRLPVT